MNGTKCFGLFGLLTFIWSNSCLGWRPYRVKVLNITAVSFSANLVINISHTKDELSMYVNLGEVLHRPFARFECYFDSGDGLFDLKYMNESVDVCRFFRDKRYLPLAQIVYRFVSQQGNFPTSCPVRKKIYAADKIKVDVEKFPPVFPEKSLFLGVSMFSKQGTVLKPIGVAREYLQVVKV